MATPTKNPTTRKPSSNTKTIPAKRQTSQIKKNSEPNEKNNKKEEEKPKKRGFIAGSFFGFFKLIKLVIILGILGAIGWYGFQFYQGYKKNDGNIEKAFNETNALAKQKSLEIKDLTFAELDKFKEEFDKDKIQETLNQLKSKLKDYTEVSSKELGSMADNYMDKFKNLVDGEVVEETAKGERVVYKSVDIMEQNDPSTAQPNQPQGQTSNNEPTKGNSSNSTVTENQSAKTSNNNFVDISKPNAPTKQEIQEKPKGLTLNDPKIGQKNNAAISRPSQPDKIESPSTPTVKKVEPHIQTYEKGKKIFMDALVYYKKAKPGEPNANKNRKMAYLKFKEAAKEFDKVSNKMNGNAEFEQIAVDTYRFMHACGKSMLVVDH